MDLAHSFTVPATVDATWDAFTDIESVAGCFPGATVTSVEGDEFKGSCKVRLGPIALVYNGSGRFVERDASSHRFVVEAKGKDKRGNGTAGATVTVAMRSPDTGSTLVEVTTDLAITGKPAQFGRGVIQDVSDKLLQQFVTCLEEKVSAADTGADSLGEAVAAEGAALRSAEATDAAPTGPTGPVRTPSEPLPGTRSAKDDSALDLGATVLPVLLRTYGKQLAAGLAVLVVLMKLLGRRRRGR